MIDKFKTRLLAKVINKKEGVYLKKREIYLDQLEGFMVVGKEDKLCKLKAIVIWRQTKLQ